MKNTMPDAIRSRRQVLQTGMKIVTATALAHLIGSLGANEAASATERSPRFGKNGASTRLRQPDENGLRLPAGFQSRVIAISGEPVAGMSYRWHRYPDGGACFSTDDGGWIYTSNCEAGGWWRGGAGALRFSNTGRLDNAYPILSRTTRNCAGGPTPWGTWLSAEEMKSGKVWECDINGTKNGTLCGGLGTFRHEACAVDPESMQIYMTEDERDGHLYRFTPTHFRSGGIPRLDRGTLEAAQVDPTTQKVRWLNVPEPNPHVIATLGGTPVRYQVPEATRFSGGEGIAYFDRTVVFVTKSDHKVHMLNIDSNTIKTIYQPNNGKRALGPAFDSMTISPIGQILLAEDSGPVRIRMMTQMLKVPVPIIEVAGHKGSEATGLAFSPDMSRLYFSSQRGWRNGQPGLGITYEVKGPFRDL